MKENSIKRHLLIVGVIGAFTGILIYNLGNIPLSWILFGAVSVGSMTFGWTEGASDVSEDKEHELDK